MVKYGKRLKAVGSNRKQIKDPDKPGLVASSQQ